MWLSVAPAPRFLSVHTPARLWPASPPSGVVPGEGLAGAWTVLGIEHHVCAEKRAAWRRPVWSGRCLQRILPKLAFCVVSISGHHVARAGLVLGQPGPG